MTTPPDTKQPAIETTPPQGFWAWKPAPWILLGIGALGVVAWIGVAISDSGRSGGNSNVGPVEQPNTTNRDAAVEACEQYISDLLNPNPAPKFTLLDAKGQDLHFHVNGSVVTSDVGNTAALTKYWACDLTGTGGTNWHVDDWTLR